MVKASRFGVFQNLGTLFGVPIMRMIIFQGL